MSKKLLFGVFCAMVCLSSTAQKNVPEYSVVYKPQVDLSKFAKDKDGFYHIFDGNSTNGWRGYGKSTLPNGWAIEEGCLKFTPGKGGGDIIFAHRFENFVLEMEWKVSKGANSGIFYLAQEVMTKHGDKTHMEPIYVSCPECQVLDNENHPDAKLGVDGNRQSSSLYDMIPAKPQNSKPWGEWNKVRIVVKNGKVTHYQNGKKVLSFQMWDEKWEQMVDDSKFGSKKWPIAFELLTKKHDGYIGLQDHGDVVWYRNVKVKLLK